MNRERFEEILRIKYDSGVHKFIGNLSGNQYVIQNHGGQVRGWTLLVNDSVVRVKTNFFSIANEIYDRELDAHMP